MKKLILFTLLALLSFGYVQAQSSDFDCNDAQAIRQYLMDKGFESSPVTIVSESDQLSFENVNDFAHLLVEREGRQVDLAQDLYKHVTAGASEGFNTAVFITKNESFCDQTIRAIIDNDFDKAKYDSSVNAHVWDNPDGSDDLLFMRINPIVINK